ncbi:hypothetical protein [Cupriavidus sp. M-11]|uniref:hypothetical protein n=1 Tax=Cupriavidus sp. M-11 TaxID=3233038 RepID=UPI003F93645F
MDYEGAPDDDKPARGSLSSWRRRRSAGPDGRIAAEVLAQLDGQHVRCIALTSTQGLARGSTVQDTI